MSQANSVLLRCDGAEDIGLGHVVRCLALAEELKAEYNCKITFAIHRGKPGIDMIKERAYPMITRDEINTFTEEELRELVNAASGNEDEDS